MKYLPNIAGALLGFAFIAFGMMYFLNMMPAQPPFPDGSAPALFMGAFAPSGYLGFVKAFEVLGGLLVAIPRTRNLGLLVLGPIVINILAFNLFIMKGGAVFQPPIIVIAMLAAYLLWCGRRKFAALLG